MKKIIALLLTVCLLCAVTVSLFSCGGGGGDTDPSFTTSSVKSSETSSASSTTAKSDPAVDKTEDLIKFFSDIETNHNFTKTLTVYQMAFLGDYTQTIKRSGSVENIEATLSVGYYLSEENGTVYKYVKDNSDMWQRIAMTTQTLDISSIIGEDTEEPLLDISRYEQSPYDKSKFVLKSGMDIKFCYGVSITFDGSVCKISFSTDKFSVDPEKPEIIKCEIIFSDVGTTAVTLPTE